MLARGNGDGVERVARTRGRTEWEERQYPGLERRGRSRERSEIPAWWGWGASRRAWLKRGPRRRRQRPRPCCIYHIITIIELRAALHHCRPIPPARPAFSPGHNRKLETLEYIFPSSLACSLVHSPRSKLFAVGRRPSSRKDANDSTTNTQSWNACSGSRMIDVWSLDTICLRSCTLSDTSRRSNYGST